MWLVEVPPPRPRLDYLSELVSDFLLVMKLVRMWERRLEKRLVMKLETL